MTTFRKFCCNDLLDITPNLMDQFATTHDKYVKQGSLSWYLNYIAEFDNYFIIATSPGNRIVGYCTARIEEVDKTKGCIITHVAVYERYYLSAQITRMLVETVDKTSDVIRLFQHIAPTNLNLISLKEMLAGTGFEKYI